MKPLGELLQPVIDLVDSAASAKRANVVRTRFTDEREPIPDQMRATVLRRDKYRCVWCSSNHLLQMDHIIPWSAGGLDTLDNLRTLCKSCNENRSNRVSVLDLEERVVNVDSCIRCGQSQRTDDMDTVWCVTCSRRSVGRVVAMSGWQFDPVEVAVCGSCDPSGWVETPAGLVRCWHRQSMGGVA